MPSTFDILAAAFALGGGVNMAGIERCGFAHVAREGRSEVRAFVFGTPETRGVYRLAIEVNSAGGRSSVEQGGSFRISGDSDRAMVGLLGTQPASETRLHISLNARAAGREVVCAVEIGDKGEDPP